MANVSDLLAERTRKNEHSTKMAELAKRSANGKLTSFAGMFSVNELNSDEKLGLETLLHNFANSEEDIAKDFEMLVAITSEVKAINNQAALLHGERIKKAQAILKRYRDGAFTAWLIKIYGNRQTPYNFLQYYEIYEAIPSVLRPRLEAMPRQAVYTLASREGPIEKKQRLIERYQGATKAELLSAIREEFPLHVEDKRQKDYGDEAIKSLERVVRLFESKHIHTSTAQKRTLRKLLDKLCQIME